MKKRVLVAVCLVVCLALAACSGGAASTSSGGPSGGHGTSQQLSSPDAAGASSQSGGVLAAAPLFECDGEYILLGTDAVLAGEAANMTSELSISGPTAFFTIEKEGANGLRLAGVAGSAGQEFLGDFADALPQMFDEYGDVLPGYLAQITTKDLDRDGVQDVVVSMGDGKAVMYTVVYRYVGGEVPFALVGQAAGEAAMAWRDGQLVVPYGTEGAQDVFVYEEGVLKALVADGTLPGGQDSQPPEE